MSDHTDPTDDRDAQPADLRQRVAQLEAVVDKQSETISDMLPSRRGVLAGAAGAAGLASLSGSASADVGGGPSSDAMFKHRVPYYRVPEADLDSPGVVGRRAEITSGGSTYEAGDQLVDTGTSWELLDSNYGSLKADQLGINNDASSRDVTIVPLGREDASSGQINFSIPTKYTLLFASYRFSNSAAGSVDLRFNGDGDSTGNYDYFDESGTLNSGKDEIELISSTGSGGESYGTLTIHQRDGSTGRPSVSHDFAGGRLARIDGYAEVGARSTTGDISSLDISGEIATNAADNWVDVWGVIE